MCIFAAKRHPTTLHNTLNSSEHLHQQHLQDPVFFRQRLGEYLATLPCILRKRRLATVPRWKHACLLGVDEVDDVDAGADQDLYDVSGPIVQSPGTTNSRRLTFLHCVIDGPIVTPQSEHSCCQPSSLVALAP